MPKYMKDADGFCYTYTAALSVQPQLTPYDGDVDDAGIATDKAKPAAAPKATKKAKEAPVVEPEAPAADPLDAALADAKLD